MSYASHEQTKARSWPKVRPYQVWLQSVNNCTQNNSNKLTRKKIIDWLVKRLFNKLHLSAEILTQGASLPSLAMAREELHTGEW